MRHVMFLCAFLGCASLGACAAPAARPPVTAPAEQEVVIAHAPLPALGQPSRAEAPNDTRSPAPEVQPRVEGQAGDGLVIEDDVVGTGREVATGDKITVHYFGRLEDGTEFDSSWKRNTPAQFTIGRGMLIQGWERGMIGMRVGGRRRLVIPPALGYGAAGRPPVIPQSATLVFEIELISIP